MGNYINLRANMALGLIFAFLANTFGPIPTVQAQEFSLPAPGVMVHLSPEYNPPILKGLKVHPDNPFRFDFILDQGDQRQPGDMASAVSPRSSYRTLAVARTLPNELGLITKASKGNHQNDNQELRTESIRLIKYFLASLTIPEKDLWVNLSPYEKDRIIPQSFGLTEMGRDLLAEDYMLKQITASLIYPEGETGKKFWKRIYEEANKRFGTTDIPVNTFNKVWIVPDKAVVYENAKAATAYVVESKLKVMLEEDYLSLSRHSGNSDILKNPVILSEAKDLNKINSLRDPSALRPQDDKEISTLGSQIVREVVIPELAKEVNEDKNFAQLRQVYNSLILATWYKKKIKASILEQVYADRNKIQGLVIPAKAGIHVEEIYQHYLQAFKKGVFNYIKEEPSKGATIPRKYFSGGLTFNMAMLSTTKDESSLPIFSRGLRKVSVVLTVGTMALGLSAQNLSAQVSNDQQQQVNAIVDQLVQKRLNHNNNDHIDYVKELSKIGPTAVDVLINKIEHSQDKEEVEVAVDLLGGLHDERELEPLTRLYDRSKENNIKDSIILAMDIYERYADPIGDSVINQLAGLYFIIKAEKPDYLHNTLMLSGFDIHFKTYYLSKMDRMKKILEWALKSPDGRIRAGAISYSHFAYDNSSQFLEFLMSLINDKSPQVRAAVMTELGDISVRNPKAKQILMDVFRDDQNKQVRSAVLGSLKYFEGEDLFGLFKEQSYKADQADERIDAMRWLLEHHAADPAVEEILVQASKDDLNHEVKMAALYLLSDYEWYRAVNLIIERSKSENVAISNDVLSNLNSMSFLFPFHTARDSEKFFIFNFFKNMLENAGVPDKVYYRIGSKLIDVANDPQLSLADRKEALDILKGEYRQRMTAIASQMEYSKTLTDVINKAIDALGDPAVEHLKGTIQNKYGRKPQGILFYLTVPHVVQPILEAEQRIGKKVDLNILTSAAFAEGYIEIARDIITWGNELRPSLNVSSPLGLDRFGAQEENLMRQGMLRKDYQGFKLDGHTFTNEAKESFPTGNFEDVSSMLEAFWALWLQDRNHYLSTVQKNYGLNEHDLPMDQIEVGTYASYVGMDFNDVLKLNGPLLLGKIKGMPKELRKHWATVYDAQWPAATAELLRAVKIFAQDRKPIAEIRYPALYGAEVKASGRFDDLRIRNEGQLRAALRPEIRQEIFELLPQMVVATAVGMPGIFDNAQLSDNGDEQKDQEPLLLADIPSQMRIPHQFIENDINAHKWLIGSAGWRLGVYAILCLGPGIDIFKSNFDLGDFLAFLLIKYIFSHVPVKQDTEHFDEKFSVVKIVEAYVSQKSHEESGNNRPFERLRYFLTQKKVAPRAFAIALNGDLIIYWKEPYIRQKIAPIVYLIPYWIAPLESWRKQKITVKKRNRDGLRKLKEAQSNADSAMLEGPKDHSKANKGGIDLTPANMNLQTNDSEGIKFHIDPAMLKQLQNAPGFVPVIINIQPLTDLRRFLGRL